MKMTREQIEAIGTTRGNLCVIASAGSGKTAVLTNRIVKMIKVDKIPPHQILAFTFTKKAATEMYTRLAKLVGKDEAKKVVISTFHSIAYRLLRVLDPEFSKLSIAPDWWILQKLNDLCQARTEKNHLGMNLGIKAGELSQFITHQKMNMIKPTDKPLRDESIAFVDGISDGQLQEAYATYERLKEESRQIDFNDMLVIFYEKLKTDDVFRTRISKQYRYLLIDEVQDTNFISFEIIKLLNTENIFVVGDPKQSIYGFLQARVDNILNFTDDFDNVKLVELNKNFRSTQNIVKLSNDVIAHSSIEKYKRFKPTESVAEVGEPVKFTIYNDETRQLVSIANEIEELNQKGTDYSEIAILVRTNAQTALIEETLSDRDIPYDVSKAQSFFDRKEVLDILSYARLAVDNSDDASFRRIYNSPNRYLSKKFVEDLEKFAGDNEMSLLESINHAPQAGEWKFKRGIDNLTRVIEDLSTQLESNAGRFLRSIIRSTRYIEHVNTTTMNASSIDEKLEAIEKLCSMASKFPTIKAFLAHVSTIKDKQSKNKGKDAVQIVTIHSSKGLEWDVVFVPNCNEGLIPHENNHDVEEERRLFYVATSRPRKRLYLSWTFYDSQMEMQNEGLFITELLGEKKALEMKKELFKGSASCDYLYSI